MFTHGAFRNLLPLANFCECPELCYVALGVFVSYYLWMQAEDIIFLVFGNLRISFSVWLIGDSYVSLKNNSHNLL